MTPTLRQKIEYLAPLLVQDVYPEVLVHELCHVVTIEDLLLVGEDMEQQICRLLAYYSPWAADWNEVKTLACELHVLREAEIDVGMSVRALVEKAPFNEMSVDAAEKLVLRATEMPIAGRRAKTVIALIDQTYEVYRVRAQEEMRC